MSAATRLVVHGHFYQPPREDPWLELVPRERGAAPDHDWNERITRECYAPLAAAPVLDATGAMRRAFNAYAWMSFDVGATLARWLAREAPVVLDAMVAGDREAIQRTGHGNAIAAPYHHAILPLASRRDKVTEVRWGIRDFRRVFGRDPLGLWLPETAADEETLEVLLEEGIRFTILAPHQVTAPDPLGRPLAWRRGDRTLSLIVYDGGLSHEVAFGDLLKDGRRFAERVREGESRLETRDSNGGIPVSDRESRISVIATDGETFGHHHRFGDLALASMLDRVRQDATVEIVGAEAVAALPAAGDATLVSPTSWSCAHGIGRWQEDCGCRMDPYTSQEWRTPLRAGLDVLAQGIDAVVERDWPVDAGDWHAARDAAGPDQLGTADLPVSCRPLLEAERHRLAMFTSCAWFFDDIARIEPRLVLRHAAAALDLLPILDGEALEEALLVALGMARANDPADGTGAEIWRRAILPGRLVLPRIAAAIAAIRDLVPEALEQFTLPVHAWTLDRDGVTIRHRRTGLVTRWATETVVPGIVASRVHVRAIDAEAGVVVEVSDLPSPARRLLLEVATPLVLEATVAEETRARLRSGAVPVPVVRAEALRGAWELVGRDGLDAADVVVHAALDLYDLDGGALTLLERGDAWRRMADLPESAARRRLAERMRLEL